MNRFLSLTICLLSVWSSIALCRNGSDDFVLIKGDTFRLGKGSSQNGREVRVEDFEKIMAQVWPRNG